MSLKDFEKGKELGHGSFGSVYIVRRKEDNKTYAMKSVYIARLQKSEKESALNEIRILASLNHINVIGYKDAFYDEPTKTLNIIMELADGGDIANRIKKNQEGHCSFHESEVWKILIQILNGLKYLHDNKIIHRDLKSANIFLMKNSTVKIGDLNVSKISELGMANTKTGTPYYASPEIWKEGPYNAKTDIWSIGCIIYEMCTNKPPFRGTSLPNLANNIMKGIYPPLPKVYSSDLSKIISLMLEVNPNKRPSCDELLTNAIIVQKINENLKNNSIVSKKDIIEAANCSNKADLMKTIKLPKNMKDINSALPHRKYKKKEENMMMHDEYESSKQQGFFKLAFQNNNNTNNNTNVTNSTQDNTKKDVGLNNNNNNLIISSNKNNNNNNKNNNNHNHNNNNLITSSNKNNNNNNINQIHKQPVNKISSNRPVTANPSSSKKQVINPVHVYNHHSNNQVNNNYKKPVIINNNNNKPHQQHIGDSKQSANNNNKNRPDILKYNNLGNNNNSNNKAPARWGFNAGKGNNDYHLVNQGALPGINKRPETGRPGAVRNNPAVVNNNKGMCNNNNNKKKAIICKIDYKGKGSNASKQVSAKPKIVGGSSNSKNSYGRPGYKK